MNQTLLNLVLALSANELVHNNLEVANMRTKLKRMAAYSAGDTYKEMAMKIDTRTKAYAISFVAFVVIVGILFGITSWLNLSADVSLKLSALFLVLAYASTAIAVDKWHVEIEKLTRPFIKKS